ncbi:uncharacterized protein LOC143917932 [Arctopsyche grandis]|uniref:uncharacterized protein LOC143917932 n=1 Tax=Arctopsyche grandis TaxID=121162 RepID=UPI00406D80BB
MTRFTFPTRGASDLLALLGICLVSTAIAQLHDESFPSDPRDADMDKRFTRQYKLKQGPVMGLILEPRVNGDLGAVEVFLGLPYAAPPVGSLRLMPPVSAMQWSGLKMATSFSPVCPQMLPDMKKETLSAGRYNYIKRLLPFLKNQSEDCLYLNLYVPHAEAYDHPDEKPKYPVLIFIHGESFEWNSGNPYDGTVLSAYGQIIVITINYRLGILGFMKPSTGEYATANFGLLDQIGVLLWVKENIAEFNGDPDSVTLVGHGTGAACVNFLMVSPVAFGLFHRVILMSGTALSDWSFTKNPLQFTIQVAQSLNCPMSADDLADCLRKKRLSDIMAIRVLVPKFVTPFGPIIDGLVIPNNPDSIMRIYKDLFSRYELLYGCTELESYHLLGPVALAHGMLESERNALLRLYARARFEYGPDLALAATLKRYTFYELESGQSAADTHRDTILDILSDAQVAAPIVQMANFHSIANPKSYFYVFSHNSVFGEYAALKKSVYGEELAYVFGIPLGAKKNHFRDDYNSQEKLLSESVMSFWTNFAKTGNPNRPRKSSYLTLGPKDWTKYDIEWPKYNPINQSYLYLGTPLFVNSHYRNRYMQYWNNELPQMLENYTKPPTIDYDNQIKTPKSNSRPIHYAVPSSEMSQKVPIYSESRPSDTSSREKFGKFSKFLTPSFDQKTNQEDIYKALKNMEKPNRPISGLRDGPLDKLKGSGFNIPMPPILMQETSEDATTKKDDIFIQKSALTMNLIVAAGILFLLINIIAFAILYYKKSRLKSREREMKRMNSCVNGDFPENEDNIYDKEIKEDNANGCSVFKSKKSKTDDFYEPVKNQQYGESKTPKSDDSGGFGQRFRLRRQMSSSTLDAHTKVRDWIAQEIVQRCSPSFLRKNDEIKEEQKANSNDYIINLLVKNEQINDAPKPNCKIGSLTGSLRATTDSTLSIGAQEKQAKSNHFTKPNDKTKKQALKNKAESGKSSKQSTGVSSKSVKSKNSASNGSLRKTEKPQKVSVAVDATPATRSSSVLEQEPIEFSKSLDYCFTDDGINRCSTSLRRSQTVEDIIKRSSQESLNNQRNNVFKSTVNLKLSSGEPSEVIKIVHKHSISDPVKDVNYTEMLPIGAIQNKPSSFNTFSTIQPPVAFRNDINVTSRDERRLPILTPAEALMTIKRRNYPKVLPDFPKPGDVMPNLAQKRLSLPPQNHLILTAASEDSSSCNSEVNSPTELKTFAKDPPLPPPRRSSTLGRNIGNPGLLRMNSIERYRTLDRDPNHNYVEMNSGTLPNMSRQHSNPINVYHSQMSQRPKNRVNMIDLERQDSFSEQSENEMEDFVSKGNSLYEAARPQPRLIIAANKIDPGKVTENKVIIRPTLNKAPSVTKNTSIPRVLARDNSFESDEKSRPSIYPMSHQKYFPDAMYSDTADAKRLNYGRPADIKIEIPVYKPDTKGPPTAEELERFRMMKEKTKSVTIPKAKTDSLTRQDSSKKDEPKIQEHKKSNSFSRSDSISKIPKTPTMNAKNNKTQKEQKVHPSPKSSRSKIQNKKSPPKTSSGIPQPVQPQKTTDATQDLDKSTSDSSNDTECSMDTVKNAK